MITLPPAVEAIIDNDPVLMCTLVVIQGTSFSYLWTDWTQDLTWGGYVFTHNQSFERSQLIADARGAQAGSLTFDEEGQQLQAIDIFNGLAGCKVSVWDAFVNPADLSQVLYAVLIGTGVSEGISFDESSASTGLLNFAQNLGTSSEGPNNTYERECSNEYGDARCKHSGNPCDFTATACSARANLANFRGCRWAALDVRSVAFGPGVNITVNNRSYED